MKNKFNLKTYLKNKKELVDKRLFELIESGGQSKSLKKAMKYSLLSGGKRLRPVLCLAAEEACGSLENLSIDCACAIEMIHAYSLIHDDLPAMDDDELRRGQLTCHKKFDEATAILAGDALLNKAFEVLSMQNIDPYIAIKIIKVISDASGDNGMIAGQMKDIEAESSDISLDELKKIHLEKTGALIRASLKSGGLIAGADDELLNLLDDYGRFTGLAFQVTDDILNVTGDPEIMGKAKGSDALKNKATYPGLMGLEKSKEYASILVGKAIKSLEIFGDNADALKAVSSYILNRNK